MLSTALAFDLAWQPWQMLLMVHGVFFERLQSVQQAG
jgi:hypothetical protein